MNMVVLLNPLRIFFYNCINYLFNQKLLNMKHDLHHHHHYSDYALEREKMK